MLEEGRINPNQLILLVVSFIIGSAALLVPGRAAGHDQWIAALLAPIEAIPVALTFVTVVARHPNRTIVQIMHEVFGPVAGRVFSGAFLLYLTHLTSLVVTNYADFFATAVFDYTPGAFIALALLVVSAYAARKGVEVIARCATVLLPLVVFLILVNGVLMTNLIRIERILPLLDVPVSTLLQSAHVMAAFPLNETVAFSMLLPMVAQARRAHRPVIAGVVLGSIYLSSMALRIYSEMGASAETQTYPLFQAIRLISVGNFLTRLEIFAIVIMMTAGFLKVTVLLYACALGTSQWANLRSYRPVVVPLGILILLASIINFPSAIENFIFAEQIYPIFALPFQIGIPLLTLLGSLIRAARMRQRAGNK